MPNFLRFGRRTPPAIEPMSKPSVSPKAAGLAAMLALAVPLIATWEGKENDPYVDLVGVLTVCYGETRGIENRTYSDAECDAMLHEAAGDFGEAVLDRNPNLLDRPYQWAAATSLSYNIGKAGYSRSTAAKRFESGNWAGGCEAMTWYNRAGGKVVRGLVNRRRDEYRLCMTGLEN